MISVICPTRKRKKRRESLGCPKSNPDHPFNTKKEIKKQIIECPPTPRQIDAMCEARRRILDEYNIWSVINKLTNR